MTDMDKSKLKAPDNTEEHREILAEIIIEDTPIKVLQLRLKDQLINSYRISTRQFHKEYWQYFDETGGHCPFQINSE